MPRSCSRGQRHRRNDPACTPKSSYRRCNCRGRRSTTHWSTTLGWPTGQTGPRRPACRSTAPCPRHGAHMIPGRSCRGTRMSRLRCSLPHPLGTFARRWDTPRCTGSRYRFRARWQQAPAESRRCRASGEIWPNSSSQYVLAASTTVLHICNSEQESSKQQQNIPSITAQMFAYS